MTDTTTTANIPSDVAAKSWMDKNRNEYIKKYGTEDGIKKLIKDAWEQNTSKQTSK